MNKLKAICDAVKLDVKIENQNQRILYLSKIWGLQQLDIAQIEGIPQPKISMILNMAGSLGIEIPKVIYNEDDLQRLHDIPREVVPDIVLLSFVQDLLKMDSWHVFYQWLGTPSQRMSALAYLGIKNMKIAEIFGKTSGTVSVAVQRYQPKVLKIERPSRNTSYNLLTVKDRNYETKQTKAF